MLSKEEKHHSHEARKRTDRYLRIERDKTDESLNKKQKASKQATDQATSENRKMTDSNRDRDRIAADAATEKTGERSASLERERKLADETIQAERKRVDAVLKLERESMEFEERKLLEDERKETDMHLAYERRDTDSSMQNMNRWLENEQLAHNKTKSSLLSREELLAIVSHDLKNPIGAILSCAEMLLENQGREEFSSATRTWIEFIKRNAGAAFRLTNDLLDVERIAAGKFELQLSPHNFIELMKKVVENFVSMAAAKSIVMRTIPPVGTFMVNCDYDRMCQVLSNLVANAVKFTPEHGKITLHLQHDEKNRIRVSVIDTGSGIPDNKKMEIFGRYSQLNNKDRQGLGLGLYISKKIIEAHGGKIWVDSKVGEGSTFTFTIPN